MSGLTNDSAAKRPMHPQDALEPMLQENKKRFVLNPQLNEQQTQIKAMYKKHMACFWTSEEIDAAGDIPVWNKLDPDERHFIKHVLAFFAASDGIVNENIVENFICKVQVPEARLFWGFQAMMEGIHSETYMLLLDTYVKDPVEMERLSNAIETIPSIKAKADFALKHMHSGCSFAELLVAFAAVEGIFFSGSFCAIFWFKSRNLKMPGLTKSNEFISRDEGLHVDFASLMYKMLAQRISTDKVHEIIRDAVAIEKEFVSSALPVELIGMNSESMCEYIDYVAQRLISSLGHTPYIKDPKQPFVWMEMISLNGKSNFFEERVTEYAKAGVGTVQQAFSLEEDF